MHSSVVDIILLALGVLVAAMNIESLVTFSAYAVSGGPIDLSFVSIFAQLAAGIALTLVVYYRRKNRNQSNNQK